MFMGKQLAGPPHADLDFIEDQQQAVLVAEIPHLGKIVMVRDIDTTLALNRLQHDGAGIFVYGGGHGVNVVERHMGETVQERIEKALHLLLAGGGYSRHGPPVEGVGRSDDAVAFRSVGRVAAVLPGQLDGSFVCFSPGIAEKSLVGKGVAAEQLSQLDLLGDLVVVGAVDHGCCLLLERLDDLRMAVAEVVDRHAGEKIQVALAVGVPELAPLAPYRHDRVPAVGLHDILVGFLDPLC